MDSCKASRDGFLQKQEKNDGCHNKENNIVPVTSARAPLKTAAGGSEDALLHGVGSTFPLFMKEIESVTKELARVSEALVRTEAVVAVLADDNRCLRGELSAQRGHCQRTADDLRQSNRTVASMSDRIKNLAAVQQKHERMIDELTSELRTVRALVSFEAFGALTDGPVERMLASPVPHHCGALGDTLSCLCSDDTRMSSSVVAPVVSDAAPPPREKDVLSPSQTDMSFTIDIPYYDGSIDCQDAIEKSAAPLEASISSMCCNALLPRGPDVGLATSGASIAIAPRAASVEAASAKEMGSLEICQPQSRPKFVLVWAKLGSHPEWPALSEESATELPKRMCWFFGSYDRSEIQTKHITPFREKFEAFSSRSKARQRKDFNLALKEAVAFEREGELPPLLKRLLYGPLFWEKGDACLRPERCEQILAYVHAMYNDLETAHCHDVVFRNTRNHLHVSEKRGASLCLELEKYTRVMALAETLPEKFACLPNLECGFRFGSDLCPQQGLLWLTPTETRDGESFLAPVFASAHHWQTALRAIHAADIYSSMHPCGWMLFATAALMIAEGGLKDRRVPLCDIERLARSDEFNLVLCVAPWGLPSLGSQQHDAAEDVAEMFLVSVEQLEMSWDELMPWLRRSYHLGVPVRSPEWLQRTLAATPRLGAFIAYKAGVARGEEFFHKTPLTDKDLEVTF